MVELTKESVGTSLKPFTFLVERGKLQEFCVAIGESNPIYFDVEAARRAGFDDTPIPPTFPTLFSFWGNPDLYKDLQGIGVDTERLLHLKQSYRYLKPIYPGTLIRSQVEVVDVKKSRMDMVTFRSIYRDEQGEPCIEEEMSIVIRPPD